ncbi:Accessory factor UbiK family protein [Azospirillaceae bacterium]
MQVESKFFDDLARVAGGAFGALSGVRNEIESLVRQQFERILSQMDVVPREEFEAVRESALKARSEQEVMAERLATLEAAVARLLAERSAPPSP